MWTQSLLRVAACPSVSGLTGGAPGGVTTLLPGRRVIGVRVSAGVVHVEVRARWGVTAAMLAGEVRAGTAALLAKHRLHVLISDIDDPPSSERVAAPGRSPASAATSPLTPPPSEGELS